MWAKGSSGFSRVSTFSDILGLMSQFHLRHLQNLANGSQYLLVSFTFSRDVKLSF